jgi:hypothetical protein
VKWEVEFHKDFDPEFDALPDAVQTEFLAQRVPFCAQPSRSTRSVLRSF